MSETTEVTTSARDELARDIFVADNHLQSREEALRDWTALTSVRGENTYAHNIATGLLAAGYVKAEPAWAETLTNDGTYEFTISSDCDGSNVQHWRRVPGLTYEGQASTWQTYEPEPAR